MGIHQKEVSDPHLQMGSLGAEEVSFFSPVKGSHLEMRIHQIEVSDPHLQMGSPD